MCQCTGLLVLTPEIRFIHIQAQKEKGLHRNDVDCAILHETEKYSIANQDELQKYYL